MGIHSFFILEILVLVDTIHILDAGQTSAEWAEVAEPIPAEFQSYVPLLARQELLDSLPGR